MHEESGLRTYKIGHAAQMLDLEPYVLRFWESEFPQLRPIRTPKGQRLYTDEHIVMIRRIKHLLYTQGLTIEGARRRLEEHDQWWNLLQDLRQEILIIKDMLR